MLSIVLVYRIDTVGYVNPPGHLHKSVRIYSGVGKKQHSGKKRKKAITWIPIPLPGPSKPRGSFDHANTKALLTKTMKKIAAGEPGTNYEDIEYLVLGRCAGSFLAGRNVSSHDECYY